MKTTLAALAPQFDAFLIDQFGVLLNGDGAYPEAPAALAQLAGMGKQVLLLSNSGKRAEPNVARLTGLGFERSSYLTVLSSGEAAFAHIQSRIGRDIARNAAVWLHSRDGDLSPVMGLDVTLVNAPEQAELMIIAGSQGDEISLDQYRNMLAPAAKKRVPAFCTNPDMTMLTPSGPQIGAGRIAEIYQDLGGQVSYVGKPFPLIYRVARDMLRQPEPRKVLCIGDSPAHDVAGGKAAGFATALVRTGLHAGLSDTALFEHCASSATPDFILPDFSFTRPECP